MAYQEGYSRINAVSHQLSCFYHICLDFWFDAMRLLRSKYVLKTFLFPFRWECLLVIAVDAFIPFNYRVPFMNDTIRTTWWRTEPSLHIGQDQAITSFSFMVVDASYKWILRECVWVCVCCNNRHKIIGKIDHQSVWWSRSNNKQHPERKTTFSISICLCFVCAFHFFLSLALVSLKFPHTSNYAYKLWGS